MKLKCNLEDCDFVPCVHRRPHTELQGCRTPGRCETKGTDVCCLEIQEIAQPETEQPAEQVQPETEQSQSAEAPAPIVVEPIQEQKINGLHSFCRLIKRWLILVEGLPENCPQLSAGEDALPCGKQCEYYELRKPNLYFSRKLKQMQKEKK